MLIDDYMNSLNETEIPRIPKPAVKGASKILGAQKMNKFDSKVDFQKQFKHDMAKKMAVAGAAGAAGAAGSIYAAKKLQDRIKAKRAQKAANMALEDSCTLDEAYEFILECEMDLINEGYELYEIYED